MSYITSNLSSVQTGECMSTELLPQGLQIGLELSHFTSYILSKTQRFNEFYTFMKSFQIVCMW